MLSRLHFVIINDNIHGFWLIFMNFLKLLVVSTFLSVFFNTESRFISLKAPKVNMRVGPGKKYPIFWVFMKTGMPFKYIAEFDQWVKIKFLDKTEG